jgi:hypothetical protein
VTPTRAKYGSAIDLRLRVRQASRTLGGMEGLYQELDEPEISARLAGVAGELREIERCLDSIAEKNRHPYPLRRPETAKETEPS